MEKRSLQNIEQLQGLLATLEHQETIKHDIVVDPSYHIHFVDGKLIVVEGGKSTEFTPSKLFHSQVQDKLKIPAGYYNRMLTDAVQLLDTNLNHWLKEEDRKFLIRTFQGAAEEYQNTARAFLSDRYGIIDNHQVLIEALDAIKATGVRVEIVEAQLSETKMYLNIVCPDIEIQAKELLGRYNPNGQRAKVGSGIISGFTLQNSEVGNGSFKIAPRALVLVCSNGMTSTKDVLKNVHLGAKMDELGFNKNKDVMNANRRLIQEQIKHAVKIFLSKEYLEKIVDQYTELGTPKIEAPIDKVIEVVGKEYNINEERKANILKYFVEGGDTRRMGLASAMTFECQQLNNPDLKAETEVASFEMLKNFKNIESAAMKIKRSSN